jgi:dihydrofolate reductase
MADLVYTANISADGYTEDRDGRLDWSAPDEEVFSFIRELERPAGTYLYGRRMYEAMLYWENAVPDEGYIREFAEMWRDADKVVYSRGLESVSSRRTRLEQDFDPESVRRLKAAADQRLTIGGADLAGQALTAGLLDEIRLLTAPVVLGGGKRWMQSDVHRPMRLVETRAFACGVVYLRYRLDSDRST